MAVFVAGICASFYVLKNARVPVVVNESARPGFLHQPTGYVWFYSSAAVGDGVALALLRTLRGPPAARGSTLSVGGRAERDCHRRALVDRDAPNVRISAAAAWNILYS